jgi:cytoskeletal protein RodZ
LQGRTAGSTVVAAKGSGLVKMGAKAHLGWVMVAAASLAVAAPVAAQSSPSPDAAPSGSSSAARPDPAPVRTKPRAAVRAAPRPAATAATPTTTVTPVTPAPAPAPARTASKPSTRKAASRRATPSRASHRRKPAAQSSARRTRPLLARLPHLTVAKLTAPPSTVDAARARKLAVGGLSLLVLALASATLLAVTLRIERRRVVR